MCTGNILDQMLRSDQVAHTPARGVKGLSGGAHRERTFIEFWLHSGDSRERNVEKAVVNLIGEDDKVVLDGQVTNALQFVARKNLSNGVVATLLVSSIFSRMVLLTVSSEPGIWISN